MLEPTYHPHAADLEAHDLDPDDRGRCVVCPPEPHPPSSAELALMRRGLTPHHLAAGGDPFSGPTTGCVAWPGGAWPEELTHGIGAVSPDPYKRRRLDGCAIHARREAAALRSRAYLRRSCGDAIPGQPPGAEPITCQRHADHGTSHCARVPGAWQWWNRDGTRRDVEIPVGAYVRGGRPADWIEPR